MQNTFVIILDDDAAAYLDRIGVTEPNTYLNELLRKEKARQERTGSPGRNAARVAEDAPDTSGYPEMKGSFRD